MEESIGYAKKYLEDILSFFGLNTDVTATHEEDVIELSIPSSQLNGFLIGQHGDTLRAMQFMTSSALRAHNFEYSRVNIDVANYKKQRADRLAEKVAEWIEEVKTSGEDVELSPMNAADRRVVHNVAGEAGLSTSSVGEGRERRVVIQAKKD